MVVGGRAPILRVLFVYLGPHLLAFFVASGLAFGAFSLFGERAALPAMPLTIVGAALSIFLGFRTNAAYGRYWEARTLWGRVVNASRHLAHQALAYLPSADGQPDSSRSLILRQAAFVHALRCHCRGQDPVQDEHLRRLLDEPELRDLAGSTNLPASLLRRTLRSLSEAADSGEISEDRLRSFDKSLRVLLDAQGGCERILGTPLPVSYSYYARRLVIVYGLLVPWALTSDIGPLTLLIAPAVAMVFLLIDNAGQIIEAPFSLTNFGLPLSAITLTIERNTCELVRDSNLLPPSQPLTGRDNNILM